MARSVPSSASSPSQAASPGTPRSSQALTMAAAIARSKPLPSLGSCAGARLIVTLRPGNSKPLLLIAGFLKRAVAESHDVEPGEAVGDVRLHLNPDTIEAEHRPGEGPGEHQGRYYTSLSICVS